MLTGTALLALTVNLQFSRSLEAAALMLGSDKTQRRPGGECASPVRGMSLCRRGRMILRPRCLADAGECAVGQTWQVAIKFGAGRLENRDHRKLIRRYCVTAMGAKMAMIATQQSVA